MISANAPPAAHLIWREVYDFSNAVYAKTIPGYYEQDSELTADAAVSGWYPHGSKRTPSGLSRMPWPGNLLDLGCFSWLHVVDSEGGIHAYKYPQRLPLLWSEDLQACFIMPGLETSKCIYRPTPREDRLNRVWAKGRPARCRAIAPNVGQPPMPKAAPGIAIAYRSDKFHHGQQVVHYIHHFGDNVVAYCARPRRGENRPSVIMVRGGNLHLTKDGLEG